MSIILGASAILLNSAIPGKEAGDYNKKVELSLKRLAKVEEAMKGFVAAYGRRPCPADGQYGVGDANFGREAANPGDCTGGLPAAPLGPDTDTQFVVGGTIPTKALNIADENAFDAWGRQFTYVVDRRATQTTSCVNLQYAGNGAVVVKGAAANQNQYVMYAYISHGPDGHGGWPRQGSSVADRINAYSADADTQDNASVDANFNVDFDNMFVRKQRTATFDDVVYYDPKMKNTCCVGTLCDITPIGFRTDDVLANNQGVEDNAGVAIAAGHGILVVGVPKSQSWSAPKTEAGSVYIFAPSIWRTFPTTLYDPAVLRIDGEDALDRFGAVVAIGQLTNNGMPSIIIGAPGHNENWGCTITNGAVYILFDIRNALSSASAPNVPHDVNLLLGVAPLQGIRMDGIFTELLGKKNTLATGDINGDSTDDLVIGWPNSEAVFTVFGGVNWGPSATWQFSQVNSGGSYPTGFLITPADSYAGIGSALATGDINADGMDDILIGYGSGDTDVIRIAFGQASTTDIALDGATGYSITGMASAFGTSTLSLASGNINGDLNGAAPIDDIIVGDNGVNLAGGGGYVIFGNPAFAPGGSMDVSTLNGTNGFEMNANDLQAAGLSAATGDINGDGFDDIMIGSPLLNSGRAYILFGKTTAYTHPYNLTALNGTDGFILQGPVADSQFGWSVASSDLDGDGFSDMFVGAPMFHNGYGSIYEVFGAAAGWSPSLDLGTLP